MNKFCIDERLVNREFISNMKIVEMFFLHKATQIKGRLGRIVFIMDIKHIIFFLERNEDERGNSVNST